MDRKGGKITLMKDNKEEDPYIIRGDENRK